MNDLPMNDVVQRARELLAAEYQREGIKGVEPEIFDADRAALRAIAAALRQQEQLAEPLREQPEARGVVDGMPAFQRWSMARGSDGARWSVYLDHDPVGEWVKWKEVQQHFFALALTAAQQPGQEGGGEVATLSVDRTGAHIEMLPAWQSLSHGEYPLYTAPPSAPVGVELDAAALGRFAQDEWMDRNSAYPAWGRLTEAEQAAWLAVGERIKRVVSLAQQPAQAAPGDGVHCATCTCQPGMTPAVRYDLTPAQHEGVIRDHLISLGWTPPGDDAAGGGHG